MNKPSPSGLHVLCDRCSKILDTNYKYSTFGCLKLKDFFKTLPWIAFNSKKWGRGDGQGRRLDFCTEKCKLVFLKGKRYWNLKLEKQRVNAVDKISK